VETGGFSGTTWTFRTQDVDRTFPPIFDLFRRIVKNTWHLHFVDLFVPSIDRETLANNLEIIKEPVTLFGTLQPGENNPIVPFDNSFPPFKPRTRKNFLDLNDPTSTAIFNDESFDADMTCHLTLDPADLPSDLFDGMTDQHREEVQQKIGRIHPEMVMFAREEDDDAPALLPGWGELGGNSILLNGVAIDGDCQITDDKSAVEIQGVVPLVGQSARVTGVMAFDIGHEDRQLEIHPVYTFDVITATTPRDDWSGVWGDTNGLTYYIHEVLNTFWILITSPFRDLSFVAVFQGEIQPDGVTVVGGWSTAPISATVGDGEMRFQLNPGKLKIVVGEGSPLGGRVLRKINHANGHPCPVVGAVKVQVQGTRVCEVKEIEGASVTYAVDEAALANLPGIQYHWCTTSGQIAGSNSLSAVEVSALPTAGTTVTVSVDITTSIGCKHHGERTFITKSHVEAVRLQLWCELRLTAVALVNNYLAPFKVLPPRPGTQAEPPSPATLHELQQALTRIEELLKALQDQRID
jgi:hypothetical protein